MATVLNKDDATITRKTAQERMDVGKLIEAMLPLRGRKILAEPAIVLGILGMLSGAGLGAIRASGIDPFGLFKKEPGGSRGGSAPQSDTGSVTGGAAAPPRAPEAAKVPAQPQAESGSVPKSDTDRSTGGAAKVQAQSRAESGAAPKSDTVSLPDGAAKVPATQPAAIGSKQPSDTDRSTGGPKGEPTREQKGEPKPKPDEPQLTPKPESETDQEKGESYWRERRNQLQSEHEEELLKIFGDIAFKTLGAGGGASAGLVIAESLPDRFYDRLVKDLTIALEACDGLPNLYRVIPRREAAIKFLDKIKDQPGVLDDLREYDYRPKFEQQMASVVPNMGLISHDIRKGVYSEAQSAVERVLKQQKNHPPDAQPPSGASEVIAEAKKMLEDTLHQEKAKEEMYLKYLKRIDPKVTSHKLYSDEKARQNYKKLVDAKIQRRLVLARNVIPLVLDSLGMLAGYHAGAQTASRIFGSPGIR